MTPATMPPTIGDHSTMNPATDSDTELDTRLQKLIHACAARDERALRGLYELVAPTLYACLTRMLRRRAVAEEVLQEVFLSIWERAAQFRADRGRPMAWLISITRYRAIDYLRRERLAPPLIADVSPPTIPAPEAHGEAEARFAGSALFERCVRLLTDQQRECLELAFVAGNSHEDIARLLDSPLGTVKSWIRRALQTLKTCLES